MRKTNIMRKTMTKIFKEHPQSATLETCDLLDIRVMRRHDLTDQQKDNEKDKYNNRKTMTFHDI